MDATGFDTFTRRLTSARSRRGALASLLAGTLGLPGLLQAEASKKRKKKKKPCPPCRKRKKGKCKGKLPDGTACPVGTCQDGACVALSCAEACAAGCCNVAGACLPGNAADACGASGRTCQNCSAQGQRCVDGQCQLEQSTCVAGSCGECRHCNNTGTDCEADPSRETLPCASTPCESGTEGICVNGQCTCQPKPPTCESSLCPECQWCNSLGTECEADPAAMGKPCSSAECEEGTEGICLSGECQCVPDQPTCASDSCPECQRCNDTNTACMVDLSQQDTPCYSVTCEGGTPGMCIAGQCQCQ